MTVKKAVPVAERLMARLRKLGLPERKAKELAKGVAPTVSRIKGNVSQKLEAKLLKLGVSKRKAKELAKGLAPTVRTAIKAKVKREKIKLDDVTDEQVNQTVDEAVDAAEDAELDKVAPRVNGHRVRLDLPVVRRWVWQANPFKGIELLRVIDGLTTSSTYLVAAVKGEQGMIAVRQFSADNFNCKFYPTMEHWEFTDEALFSLGATDFLSRQWYQRVHVSRATLDQILQRVEAQNKPKKTGLLSRLLSVPARTLVTAFGFLHTKIGNVA